ncbi:MAG: hypothetical protein QOF46_1909 [Paraburkholderia sp.]|jgi:hypothetical protein|nr:hypothetical protein [Paraburkholderia sp.]
MDAPAGPTQTRGLNSDIGPDFPFARCERKKRSCDKSSMD